MTMDNTAMSAESISSLLSHNGAQVRSRSGRTEHYGSPRDFSFAVKAVFDNGLALQIIARQYNYRDPWENSGRVNDLVDVTLFFNGQFSELPKGYRFFQDQDTEESIDYQQLVALVDEVKSVNPKLFQLQSYTGDL